MDEVFHESEEQVSSTDDRKLYDVLSGMASDMSRDIVTSSLSSLSPADGSLCGTSRFFDIPDEDEDCDEDSNDPSGKRGRGIIEDWEPETSESGSYVIENFENVVGTTLDTSALSGGGGGDDDDDDGDFDIDDNNNNNNNDNNDPVAICEAVDERKTISYAASPLNRRFHGITKGGCSRNKHEMALERLTDLMSICEPFQEIDRPMQSTFGLKPPVKAKERENEEAKVKVKVEEWNFRLDRLLHKHEVTNWKFVKALLGARGCSDFDVSDEEEEEVEKARPIRPVVEFNRGDVKRKRSIISFQSPIWKPGFIEEMEKSRKVMEELNRSIETREANLQKLADNQTIDYYTGLALRCFERQQSDRDLKEKFQYGSLKPRKRSRENVQPSLLVGSEAKKQEVRSNSLSSLPSAMAHQPHQPQQSDHIKCFTLKHQKEQESRDCHPSSGGKPSIIDFVKQANQPTTNANLNKLQSHSTSSKISDEGYDDDVFYRDDESGAKETSDKVDPRQPKSAKSRSQPLFNYFGNSQLLQIVSQQNRNKMKKRSQQRRRQIKKKLENSLPKQDFFKRTTASSASNHQSTPTQQTKSLKQTFNCMSGQVESKFNSLRLNRKETAPSQSTNPAFLHNQSLEEVPSKQENTNVFSKFYHWFQGKVSGKEF